MNKSAAISALICFLSVHLAGAQTLPSWHVTPAPFAFSRYDDITFINDQVGWAVDFGGQLIKTIDQGNSWQPLTGPEGYFYRSICFLDSSIGFIGKIDTTNTSPSDTNFLYRSVDGGNNWTAITNLPGPRPAGICGMFHVTDSIVYAVGRYSGPAGVYKTTDKGLSWQYTDMSPYAFGLVDCYFWSPDSGIVVGDRGATNPWDSGGVILSTYDGGTTWQERYSNSARPCIYWKISFPSRKTGYVSIQSFDGITDEYFLKTTDGGLTWQEYLYSTSYYNAEGIGFLNDSVGWIGGGFENSFKTTDGGATWVKDTLGYVQPPYLLLGEGALNRFRFLSDTLGFASGVAIYRFSKQGFVSAIFDHPSPTSNQLEVHPNPSHSSLMVSFTMSQPGYAKMIIETLLGQRTVLMPNALFKEGKHTREVNVNSLENGIYFLVLETDHSISSTRMVISH